MRLHTHLPARKPENGESEQVLPPTQVLDPPASDPALMPALETQEQDSAAQAWTAAPGGHALSQIDIFPPDRPPPAPESDPWQATPLVPAQFTPGAEPDQPLLHLASAQQTPTAQATPTAQPNPAQAQPAAAAGRTPEQVETLIDQTLRAVAQHETGGQAVESRMDTSAGVRASYASQVQATTDWTITALRRLDRDTLQNEFQLTRADLNQAEQRARAAGQLWDAMRETNVATVEDFLADQANQRLLEQSGLSQDDARTMFSFHQMRVAIRTAYTQRVEELQALDDQALWDRSEQRERARAGIRRIGDLATARRRNLVERMARREVSDEFAGQSPASDLQIDDDSLDAYLRGNWREDRAAWVRRAVENIPAEQPGQATIGERIAGAATAEGGLALGRHEIGRLVNQYLQTNPNASDEDVVRHVARRHNPGAGADYVNSVLRHFRELQQ